MYNNSAVFTITFTSNNDTYNITFKNKIIINTSAYQNLSGRGTLICATSQLDFSEDVFFKFTGEAITIETSEIRDLLDSAAITTGPANFTKNSNPSGFNDPVIITQAGANFVVNPLGPQTNPAPGQFNFNDFVIPKVGTGIGGNKMLDTLGPDANITIPLININYLEIFNSTYMQEFSTSEIWEKSKVTRTTSLN